MHLPVVLPVDLTVDLTVVLLVVLPVALTVVLTVVSTAVLSVVLGCVKTDPASNHGDGLMHAWISTCGPKIHRWLVHVAAASACKTMA